MTWKTTALLGAMAVLMPGLAAAQGGEKVTGFYLGGAGGLNYMDKADIDGSGLSGGEIDTGYGWAATVTAGYDFGGPRVELEGGYRLNNADDCPVACSGTFKTWSAMANVYYDFHTGTAFTPYLGIGLGAANTDVEDLGDKWVFAYQGIVGVSYDVMPSLKAYADYRYFATEDLKLGSPIGPVKVQNENHTGLIGVRYTFAAPREEPRVTRAAAPAPAPLPAPAPPPRVEPLPPAAPVVRSYLVFFEFDKSTLTPDAQRIVETAASNAQAADVTRLDVTGHTDRAGSARYNMRLSMRRAETVRAELIRNGVPPSEISIYAKGETEPLVPTRDGVREAQNRRVEIVLQ